MEKTMKLGEFRKTTKGRASRLAATVADVTGAKDYELAIAGPAALIEKVLSKSDFSVTIDPGRTVDQTAKDLEREVKQRLEEFSRAAMFDDLTLLPIFKKAPVPPAKDKTLFVSLRRTRGEGTFWSFGFSYVLPRGSNIIVYPPALCGLTASVTPATGDQDLFLSRFLGSQIMSAVRGGTRVDTVFFDNPPLTPCDFFHWNLLVIRILGFTAGRGAFMMRGVS
jgi:hypothetical protein